MNALRGYLECIGKYYEYIKRRSVHWRDTMIYVCNTMIHVGDVMRTSGLSI